MVLEEKEEEEEGVGKDAISKQYIMENWVKLRVKYCTKSRHYQLHPGSLFSGIYFLTGPG